MNLSRTMMAAVLGVCAAFALAQASAFRDAGAGLGLAAPLDDAYIYFQYARQAAQGEWFVYQGGQPHSTGVTSPLYLALLALMAKCRLEGPAAALLIGAACLFFSLLSLESLRRRHAPGLGTAEAAALLLCSGPLLAGYFNGLETGLFFALLLASLDSLSQSPAPGRAWWLLAALAWTRPEGQVAAALFSLWAVAGGRMGPARTAALLLAAAGPSLLFWWLTGSAVPDSVRAKNWAMAGMAPAARLQQALDFAAASLKWVFFGFYRPEAGAGAMGSAAAGNPPHLHYAPLALFFAGLGYLRGSRAGGPWLPLAAWALAGWLLQCWNLPVGWHQHRYLALYAPALMLGFMLALEGHPAMRKGLFLLWCLFGLLSSGWFLLAQNRSARLYQEHHGRAARWLKDHASPQTRIAVADAGLVAWESGLPITDLLGVTDHRIALALPRGKEGILAEVASRAPGELPRLALLHWDRPDLNPREWVESGLLFEIAHRYPGEGGGMGIFEFDWNAP